MPTPIVTVHDGTMTYDFYDMDAYNNFINGGGGSGGGFHSPRGGVSKSAFEGSNDVGLLSAIRNISIDVKNIGDNIKGAYDELKNITKEWGKIDDAASKYVKSLGGTKAAMDNLRQTTLDNFTKGRIGIDFNISADKIIELQKNLANALGRNVKTNDILSMQTIGAMENLGMDVAEWGKAFDTFGMGIVDAGKHAGKLFTEASKKGLSFEKTSKDVAQNIKIAQNYTFKDGVKGLERMAMKAAAVKLDMQVIAGLAEKVNTVEGSIDVASKLQVLGGPFANMADPMGMLNEGLNDIEGLEDRVIKMIGGLGSFNKQTGEVVVSGFNRRRIAYAAQAMGTTPEQLMNSVNADARRRAVEKELMASENGRGLSKEMKELVMNTATFENGKAVVSIGGDKVGVEKLVNDNFGLLVKETQGESDDIKDISRNLQSLLDYQTGAENQYDAMKAKMTNPIAKVEKWATSNIGRWNFLLGTIASIATLGGIIGIVGKFANIGSIIKGGFKNMFGGGSTTSAPEEILDSASGNGNRGGRSRRGVRGKKGGLADKMETKLGKKLTKIGKSKIGKKLGVKGGKKIARKLLTGAAKGGGLSIAGAVGDIATDMLVDSGKIEKGGTAHAAMKGGSAALEGAGLGLAIGGGLAALGATGVGLPLALALGAVMGGRAIAKVRRGKELEERLKGKNIQINGDYSPERLKRINEALETGEMSNSLKKKLLREGDTALIAEIENKKKNLEEEEEAKKEAKRKKRIERIKDVVGIFKNEDGGEGIKKSLKSAYFNVEVAHFGGKGMFSPKLEEGKYERIRSKSRKGKGIGAGELGDGEIGPKDFNININGTLKLEGQNGQSIDIINILKKNPNMLTTLSDMIAKEIGRVDKQSYVVNKGGR